MSLKMHTVFKLKGRVLSIKETKEKGRKCKRTTNIPLKIGYGSEDLGNSRNTVIISRKGESDGVIEVDKWKKEKNYI